MKLNDLTGKRFGRWTVTVASALVFANLAELAIRRAA